MPLTRTTIFTGFSHPPHDWIIIRKQCPGILFMKKKNARGGIWTREPLRERILSPSLLTRLRYPRSYYGLLQDSKRLWVVWIAYVRIEWYPLNPSSSASLRISAFNDKLMRIISKGADERLSKKISRHFNPEFLRLRKACSRLFVR